VCLFAATRLRAIADSDRPAARGTDRRLPPVFFMSRYHAAMAGESLALILVGILTFAVGGLVVAAARYGGAPGTDIVGLFELGMVAQGPASILDGVTPTPPKSH